MDALSTEIDDNIIRRLPRAALSFISKTSKYYRSLAEPHLYRDLIFSVHQHISIMRLFLTLTIRPELAPCIRSFVLTEDEHREAGFRFDDAFLAEIWAKVPFFQSIINKIAEGQEASFAMRWLSVLLKGRRYFDGPLVIILCMATNLEHLTLVKSDVDSLEITCEALTLQWYDKSDGENDEEQAEQTEGKAGREADTEPAVSMGKRAIAQDGKEALGDCKDKDESDREDCSDDDDVSSDYEDEDEDRTIPFCKLRTLCIGNVCNSNVELCAPVLPSLEALQLMESNAAAVERPFCFPYMSAGLATNLQNVSIIKVNLQMPEFEKMLSNPHLRGLKELDVREVGWNWENGPWNEYDFARMSKAITTSLPELRKLEWSRNNYDREWGSLRPFGSFRGLHKLAELVVDYEMITPVNGSNNFPPHEQPAHLLNSPEFLPDSLQTLQITDIHAGLLWDLCSDYTIASRQPLAVNFVLQHANIMRLETFELAIKMESDDGLTELLGCVRDFLPVMINALSAIGTTMRVWRQEGVTEKKLLYEPGFAAEIPHWSAEEVRKYRSR